MDTYRNPKPTVDIIILTPNIKMVLVKRKNEPLGWALPGGFVNEGESCEQAAVREAKEETGLDIELVRQFHTYSSPTRDPRQHVMTTVFVANGPTGCKGADDAAEAKEFGPSEIPWTELVFDHADIIRDFTIYSLCGVRPGDIEGELSPLCSYEEAVASVADTIAKDTKLFPVDFLAPKP